MADTKRKRFVSTKIENGVATFNLFGPPNEDGEQTVDRTATFHPASSPRPSATTSSAKASPRSSRTHIKACPTSIRPKPRSCSIAFSTPSKKAHGHRADLTMPANRTTSFVAMAEATGRPVHVIQNDIDERIQKDAEGNPIRDKKGRTRKFFTQAVLAKLAQDPRVAPIMARLAKERADRMAAAAKGQKRNAPSTLDTMFANPETEQPAAVAAQ
jgi:hypothetical protein